MENNKILYNIRDLSRAIAIYLNKDETINKRKKQLTPTQIRIINYIIDNNKDIYQKNLEKELNITRATISGVLHTMEKNGIIKRVVNNNDARSKKIIINNGIKKDFIEVKEKLYKKQQKIINNIDEKELEIFLKVLNKMKENIDNDLKKGTDIND